MILKKTKKLNSKKDYSPVLLMILDGFGIRKSLFGNGVKLANMQFYKSLVKTRPFSKLYASEEYVGLPKHQIGNSEIGHMTIGSGRIIDTDLVHINKAINSGEFFKNKVLLDAMQKSKKKRLHLMGLLSDGGVHSHINHLFALMKMAKKNNVERVFIHCFLDGRDVPPRSAKTYIKKLQKRIKRLKIGTIATLIGRFYAMDRDNRWNREHAAYDLLVNGNGRNFIDKPLEAIDFAYSNGESDEFVKPTLVDEKGLIKKDDVVIFFNFRSDRARELTRAFTTNRFKQFRRKKKLSINFVCLTMYDKNFKLPIAFEPRLPKNTLGEVVSKKGLKQLRIAETEKFAHVTFFFNGGNEVIYKNEKRIIIPSPKVLTYDLKPEMSAKEVTNKLIKELDKKQYDFIVLNFANPDMVGHTGSLKAVIKALESLDPLIKRIVDKILFYEGDVLIIADHGNCEKMIQKDGSPHTAHTTNRVPCILVSNKKEYSKIRLKDGSLKDVAPTILDLLNIKKPDEMTGSSLIVHHPLHRLKNGK